MPASDLPDPAREILNLDEAAAYLGVSSKTFQKVLREGDLPGRKVGREWKFSRRALEAWIGAGRCRDFLDGEDETEASSAAPVERAVAAAAGANGARIVRGDAAAVPAAGGAARPAARPRHGAGAFEAEED